MMNIFYTQKDNYFYISNTTLIVAIASAQTTLSEYGVKQFILKEANISQHTIFTKIFRLAFGNTLTVRGNNIAQEKKAFFCIDHISFDQYLERISVYFDYIRKYQGAIATDLSAGFDTRLIASIGHKLIPRLEANTNPNKFDNGVDEALAPIIAEQLGLHLTFIDNQHHIEDNEELMLLGFAIGRDIIRSRQWPYRMKAKYSKYDLILGGYGGEVLRAKYNANSTIPEIAHKYYNANIAQSLWGKNCKLNTQIITDLEGYSHKEAYSNNHTGNWVYAVDRMRIWGGSQVLMSSLYGDILHPFMDWHLLNPVFAFKTKNLLEGNLQKKIIHIFAPQLDCIPINLFPLQKPDSLLKAQNKWTVFIRASSRRIKRSFPIIRKLLTEHILYNAHKKTPTIISSNQNRNTTENLLNTGTYDDSSFKSRALTIQKALSYARKNLTN